MPINPYTRSLDPIVDVVIQISPLAAPRPNFNQALIVGTSTVISDSDRIKPYSSVAEMLTAGFAVDSPEVKAATLYFGAKPAPDVLWVGRQGTEETALAAIQACRAKNYQWYACFSCQALTADHKLIAEWIESASPSSVYFFNTQDADVPPGTAGNIFEYLKGKKFGRTIGQYSTASPYAICAIMGYAMGQNTGLANSAYTLKFKQEIGVDTEDLDTSQITNIEGDNGNVYLSYSNYYTIFEPGVMANGQFFDEVINLDMLVNNIQLSVMDLLYANPKIPQTDAGVTHIVHAINMACDQAVLLGFLAPGVWTGLPVLNLNTGDMLPKGYLVQAATISSQSQGDREERKSPPIYVAIKEAGAVHSVLIGVYVNR